MSLTQHRIGILGGSFDPVHNGHLAAAQLAVEHLHLDRVFFVPAGLPPHKPDTVVAPARHRLAMLRKAVVGTPAFVVWDGEIRRGGTSYSIDTLRALSKLHPRAQLFFIIGSDNISEMLTWRNYGSILKLVTVCVAHRPGFAARVPPGLADADIVPLPSPEWGLSSSMVRSYAAKGLSCAHLIPATVRKYIGKHGLYRGR